LRGALRRRSKKSNKSFSRRWPATLRRKPSNRNRNGSFAFRNVAFPGGTDTKDRTVGTYRLYCLDGVGKVASAEWVSAEGDEDALRTADKFRRGRACELWQGDRLVARLDPKGPR
jgi:hypothetical protein